MQANAKSIIRVIVVAEHSQQRLAFSDTIRAWGFELVDCISAEQLTKRHFLEEVDIWLVDSQKDYDIIQNIENQTHSKPPEAVLVGFTTAPFLNESQLYAKWQRQLKRKIAHMLRRPDLIEKSDEESSAAKPWQYVVLLGASMGGPLAVKEFLDELPESLPIALILVQHFNANMINTLPRIISRHNGWRCEVMTTTQQLQSGRCLIVPIEKSVVCNSNGRVILLKQGWNTHYQPSISQMLKNCSDAFGNRLVNIIFSGMGNDGSDSVDIVVHNDSVIWAQTPDNSTCPSQPQSMIDTGKVSYVADPKDLAQALIRLCETKRMPNKQHLV